MKSLLQLKSPLKRLQVVSWSQAYAKLKVVGEKKSKTWAPNPAAAGQKKTPHLNAPILELQFIQCVSRDK
jgi:hypothetical protein